MDGETLIILEMMVFVNDGERKVLGLADLL